MPCKQAESTDLRRTHRFGGRRQWRVEPLNPLRRYADRLLVTAASMLHCSMRSCFGSERTPYLKRRITPRFDRCVMAPKDREAKAGIFPASNRTLVSGHGRSPHRSDRRPHHQETGGARGVDREPAFSKIQAQSRHKSLDVLSGYVRLHELFEDHAGSRLLTSTKSGDGS
jgi:hypothetical protein